MLIPCFFFTMALLAGWNTLGNAMKTSRDKVKKTLSTMTETKDVRGAGRVAMLRSPRHMKQRSNVASCKVGQLGLKTGMY